MARGKITRRRKAAMRQWFASSELAQQAPKFDPDVIEAICVMLVDEGVSLHKICKEQLVPGAPSLAQIQWLRRADPRIDAAIGAARQASAELKWAQLGEEIDKAFDDALLLEDKMALMAAEKRMKLKYDHTKLEVQKLVPAIYGDEKKMTAGNFKDVLEQARREGLIITERVLEVPAKNERVIQKKTDQPEVSEEDQRNMIIDLPKKTG